MRLTGHSSTNMGMLFFSKMSDPPNCKWIWNVSLAVSWANLIWFMRFFEKSCSQFQDVFGEKAAQNTGPIAPLLFCSETQRLVPRDLDSPILTARETL